MQSHKLTRFRRNESIRQWTSETTLQTKDFILPVFVIEGSEKKEKINSMPGVYRYSIDKILKEISDVPHLKSILLFGVPVIKDDRALNAYVEDNIVAKAVRAIRQEFKDLIIITDICICAYTLHGHCRVVSDNSFDHHATLEALTKMALSHARSGADFVAPSAMMEGQVRAIRQKLDKHDLKDTGILAYSAKYASNFYGPFREAADSAPKFGDRKSYQLDYRNAEEALKIIEQDILQGADIIMVKPALAYLDIIFRAKEKFNLPIAAYNVSGEYAMVKSLSHGNKQIEQQLILEMLTSMKRAGSDFIITYFAKEIIHLINKNFKIDP